MKNRKKKEEIQRFELRLAVFELFSEGKKVLVNTFHNIFKCKIEVRDLLNLKNRKLTVL